MDVTLVEEDVSKPMVRTTTQVNQKPGDKYAELGHYSRWDPDNIDLCAHCPDPAPEGLMMRPEWRDVEETRGGKKVMVRALFHVPVPPIQQPVKVGTVDVTGMTEDQLRTYCDENNIVTNERPGKPLRKDQLLEIIRKAGK